MRSSTTCHEVFGLIDSVMNGLSHKLAEMQFAVSLEFKEAVVGDLDSLMIFFSQ